MPKTYVHCIPEGLFFVYTVIMPVDGNRGQAYVKKGLGLGEGISAEAPDWSREKPRRFWDPSRKLLSTIRHYQYWRNKRGMFPGFFRRLVVFRYRFWSVVTGSEIDLSVQIGGGLLLPHPNGVVIHPKAKIGINCLIHQQVTIGTWKDGGEGVPTVEGHVKIYAGAKLLGPIHIGAYATIGANTVVLVDVPDRASVMGALARRVC
jgi:serine O-acetyltransferase